MVDGTGAGQGPDGGGDGYVLSRTVFDRAGRVTAAAADNAAVTTFQYDGAGRQIQSTDPADNTVESEYDPNGNVVRTTSTEQAAIADPPEGLASEAFESLAWYDSLNRLVASASQGADGTLDDDLQAVAADPSASQTLLTRVGYDSRGNQTVVIDPKGNTAVAVSA